jgi:hypothetical protein
MLVAGGQLAIELRWRSLAERTSASTLSRKAATRAAEPI